MALDSREELGRGGAVQAARVLVTLGKRGFLRLFWRCLPFFLEPWPLPPGRRALIAHSFLSGNCFISYNGWISLVYNTLVIFVNNHLLHLLTIPYNYD